MMNKSLFSKIKYIITIAAILIGLPLSGCGKEQSIQQAQNISTHDWKKDGFVVSDTIEEKQELWIQDYVKREHNNISYDGETEEVYNGSFSEVGVRDGKIYRLNTIIHPPIAVAERWVLEVYNTYTMQTELKEFSYEQLGLTDSDNGYLVGMAALDEQKYCFHMADNTVIYSDLSGNVEKVQLPIETEQDIVITGECICDAQENFYLRKKTGVSVWNKSGELLAEYDAPNNGAILLPVRTNEGDLIFPVYQEDAGEYRLVWFDTEKKEWFTLAVLKDKLIRQFFGMQDNTVFYEDEWGIVKWDITTGKRTVVLNFSENGISNSYNKQLILRQNELPVLRLYENKNEELQDWLAILSAEMVEKAEDIKVVSLVDDYSGSGQVTACAAIATRNNLNNSFVCESSKGQGSMEEFRDKIMTEMATGGGPDILYVSRPDMKLMAEKGLLLELDEVLSEEIKNVVLPGVWDLGTEDEILWGMAPSVFASSMVIDSKSWKKDTWTIEDLLELMEKDIIEDGIYYADAQSYLGPLAVVRFLLFPNLKDSFLIDWENGESHFEDERLIRLLQEINIDTSALELNAETWLKDGARVAFCDFSDEAELSAFGKYSEAEGGKYIGLPTEVSSGNYLNTEGVLVVNKNASNPKAVAEFMECMLSDDVQNQERKSNLSVLKLNLDEIVYDRDESTPIWRGNELLVYDDGTTSLHKAKAFLESCVAFPQEYPEIENIIFEELQALYFGDKSAKQVAEIIDNRVQLYLDERK